MAEARQFVAAHGIDGLNLDMEGLEAADRPAFGELVATLSAAIHADDPAAEVSVATNANVSGARMAKVAIDAGVDRAFLMGYAYRVASSPAAGAIAPFTGVGTTSISSRASTCTRRTGSRPSGSSSACRTTG